MMHGAAARFLIIRLEPEGVFAMTKCSGSDTLMLLQPEHPIIRRPSLGNAPKNSPSPYL